MLGRVQVYSARARHDVEELDSKETLGDRPRLVGRTENTPQSVPGHCLELLKKRQNCHARNRMLSLIHI